MPELESHGQGEPLLKATDEIEHREKPEKKIKIDLGFKVSQDHDIQQQYMYLKNNL